MNAMARRGLWIGVGGLLASLLVGAVHIQWYWITIACAFLLGVCLAPLFRKKA